MEGSIRTENVMEADDPSLHAIVAAVMRTQLLGDQLLPAIGILCLGGISLGFTQGRDIWPLLPVLRVNAGRRGKKVAANAVYVRGFKRVQVDQRIVMQNPGVIVGDVAHTT